MRANLALIFVKKSLTEAIKNGRIACVMVLRTRNEWAFSSVG